MGLIISSVPKAWHDVIVSLETADAAVAWIKEKFLGKGAVEHNRIYRAKLEKGSIEPGETLEAYFFKKRSLARRLQSTGAPVDDMSAIQFAIDNLPQAFASEKAVWRVMGISSWEAIMGLVNSVALSKGINVSEPFTQKAVGTATPQQVGLSLIHISEPTRPY